VKRKADTTTPGAAVIRTSPYDTPFDSSPTPTITKPSSSSSSASKVTHETGKLTKKSRKDSTDSTPVAASRTQTDTAAAASKLSPALEFCREILKELFGKRHAVSCYLYLLTYCFQVCPLFIVLEHCLLDVAAAFMPVKTYSVSQKSTG